MVGGQILWEPGRDAAVHTYDAAGHLVMKAYEGVDGGLKMGDRTLYTGAGQAMLVLGEDVADPNQLYVKEKRVYDLNGRITDLKSYYELGKEKSANDVTTNVEGWLRVWCPYVHITSNAHRVMRFSRFPQPRSVA